MTQGDYSTKRRRLKIERLLIVISIPLIACFIAHRLWVINQPTEVMAITHIAEELELEPLYLSDYELPKETFKSLGTWRITFYCPCSKCNGKNAGYDCHGNKLVDGTIACNDLPQGTEVYINLDGVEKKYVVRDKMAKRFTGKNCIDIFVNVPHKLCQDYGVIYTEVLIKG